MQKIRVLGFICFAAMMLTKVSAQQAFTNEGVTLQNYDVARLKKPMKIDANWHKREWSKINSLSIRYPIIVMDPAFKPTVRAKMMYDDANIYVIFQVKDRYVRTVTTDIGGPVWKDAAVEFFFSPDTSSQNAKSFFNLEINSGGTPLVGYSGKKISEEDIKQIEIAHTLPAQTDPEIKKPFTWVLEYRIPLAMIEKYSNVAHPKKDVIWRGNLYKIAEISSNPHYLSWSQIIHPKPSFHLPQFFGYLNFR